MFEGQKIRFHIDTNKVIWAVSKDICDMLGISNNRDAVKRIDPEYVSVVSTITLRGKRKMLCVNEFGMYELIFNSRKQGAKKFKKWIFESVLPSIRKTGGYSITNTKPTCSNLLREHHIFV